jgi:hypothetical protein
MSFIFPILARGLERRTQLGRRAHAASAVSGSVGASAAPQRHNLSGNDSAAGVQEYRTYTPRTCRGALSAPIGGHVVDLDDDTVLRRGDAPELHKDSVVPDVTGPGLSLATHSRSLCADDVSPTETMFDQLRIYLHAGCYAGRCDASDIDDESARQISGVAMHGHRAAGIEHGGDYPLQSSIVALRNTEGDEREQESQHGDNPWGMVARR